MGVIRFCCCTNDRRASSLIKLIAAKNIFSRQLPKMPRDYIARLVLDRSHFTFCLCKKDRVVGGVCFRPYFQQVRSGVRVCCLARYAAVYSSVFKHAP